MAQQPRLSIKRSSTPLLKSGGWALARIVTVLALCGSLSATAYGQQPQDAPQTPSVAEKDTARTLLKAGMVLFEQQDYESALKSFRAADLIMGVPSTRLWVGKAQDKLGKLLEARDTLLSVKRMTPQPQEPAAFVLAREEANQIARTIERRIPAIKLQLRGVREGVELYISIDGRLVRKALLDFPQRLNPGRHTIVATIPGVKLERVVTLDEGDTPTVTLSFPTAAPVPEPPAADLSPATALGDYLPNPYLGGSTQHEPVRAAASAGAPPAGVASSMGAGPAASMGPTATGASSAGAVSARAAAPAVAAPAMATGSSAAGAGHGSTTRFGAHAMAAPHATLPGAAQGATPGYGGTTAEQTRDSTSPLTGLGFGIGAAGLLVGMATAGVAAARFADIKASCSALDDCSDSYASSLSMVHASIGSSVLGLVFSGIGVGSLLLSNDASEQREATTPSLQLSPLVSQHTIGLSARLEL